jgi:hypothetical protein
MHILNHVQGRVEILNLLKYSKKTRGNFDSGVQKVVLKRLGNIENANQIWLEEVCTL